MNNDISTLISILDRLDFSTHHLQAQRYLLTSIGLPASARELDQIIRNLNALIEKIKRQELGGTEEGIA